MHVFEDFGYNEKWMEMKIVKASLFFEQKHLESRVGGELQGVAQEQSSSWVVRLTICRCQISCDTV